VGTQPVVNILTKKTSRMHLKSGINAGIGLCPPNGTNLKVMVQNKIQVRRNSCY
jgi:hypothetical protein